MQFDLLLIQETDIKNLNDRNNFNFTEKKWYQSIWPTLHFKWILGLVMKGQESSFVRSVRDTAVDGEL